MTSDEKFRALVAHPYCHLIAFRLAAVGRKHGTRKAWSDRGPWSRELVYIATALVDARARGRT